jgi:hypothetical protein
MQPPGPAACLTDYLWFISLGAISLVGYLLWYFMKKGVIERLDDHTKKLEEFLQALSDFQVSMLKEFIPRSDYNQLLVVRQEAHKIINGRLQTVEQTNSRIENKIDTFHDDMRNKMNRLSKTFVFRDAVISMRLDNLSDKIGVDKWTKENESALAANLKEQLNAEDVI